MNRNKQKSFFNFMMIDTKSDVIKDQPRVISTFFFTLIIFLLVIDTVAIFFYLKTN